METKEVCKKIFSFKVVDYVTPKTRYDAWKTYKDLVDAEVKRLEKLYNKANNRGESKEEIRRLLNEMYHTQYELEHNMI